LKSESILRETQNTIIDAIAEQAQQMIVAGMGAGKTVSHLTGFKRLQDQGEVRKGIVLAPPRVVDLVWPRECAKWEHLQDIKVVAVRGTPKQRLAILEDDAADIYAVALPVVKWLADVAKTWSVDDPRLDMLGIDEISKLRDPRSKLVRYGFDHGFWARFKSIYGYTGTIRPEGYEDLWNTYRVISQASIWKGQPFDEWRRERFMPLDQKGYKWRIHGFCRPKVDAQVGAFTTAVEADLDLPALNIGEDWDVEVPLSTEQTEAYDSMLEDLLVEIGYEGDLDPEMVVALSAAIQSGKLSQIVQGFIMDKVPDASGEKLVSVVKQRYQNAKLDWLVEERADMPDENALICYYFKEDLAQLQAALPKAGHLGAGVTPARAIKTVDQWNDGKIHTLLCHPASVGHGVELQFGGRLIYWYTPTWSSEQYDQMVKRLHRPGQTKPVISRRLLGLDNITDTVKANRVDNKVVDLRAFERLLKGWTDARRRA
jgi:hypothetical protein